MGVGCWKEQIVHFDHRHVDRRTPRYLTMSHHWDGLRHNVRLNVGNPSAYTQSNYKNHLSPNNHKTSPTPVKWEGVAPGSFSQGRAPQSSIFLSSILTADRATIESHSDQRITHLTAGSRNACYFFFFPFEASFFTELVLQQRWLIFADRIRNTHPIFPCAFIHLTHKDARESAHMNIRRFVDILFSWVCLL